MSSTELIQIGDCPNGHGEMVFFNKPIDVLYHIPEDLMDPLEGLDTPPGMYGYIAAICQECGFTLSLEKIENQPKYIEWLKEFRDLRRTEQ